MSSESFSPLSKGPAEWLTLTATPAGKLNQMDAKRARAPGGMRSAFLAEIVALLTWGYAPANQPQSEGGEREVRA